MDDRPRRRLFELPHLQQPQPRLHLETPRRVSSQNVHVSPVALGWHCWPPESDDQFVRNIVVIAGAKPGQTEPAGDLLRPRGSMCEHPWGEEMDRNLYWNVNTRTFQLAGHDWQAWQARGYDRQSVFADPRFVDPLTGDYRVEPDSPALALGFQNFPMDQFGHRMTRIVPFGGEFTQPIQVTIRPDARGGNVHYTTDGSLPTPQSPRYRGPLVLTETTTLTAWTCQNGLPQGFPQKATFAKVDEVSRPSWLESLLAGRRIGPTEPKAE